MATRPKARPGLWGAAAAAALLAALLAGAPAPAQFAFIEKATLDVQLDHSAYAPGTPARLAVLMSFEETWHSNSHEPTLDNLIPTEAELVLPEGWAEAHWDYPEGEMAQFEFADQPISVYSGTVPLVAHFEVPPEAAPGSVPVEARVRYQACDDKQCLPPVTSTVSAELRIGDGGEPNTAFLTLPGAAGGPGGAATGGDRTSLGWMLFFGLVGGLILNVMPCVLPVLSLKVFSLVKAAARGRQETVRGSLAAAAGILVSFWGLALAAVLARSAGRAVGWGVQFQEPGFVTALAVIVVLFCLNLWGLFEIQLPAFLRRRLDSGESRESLGGHFASGLFATLMATPCTAPFLGTALGFALTQPAGTVFAVFTAVGAGMALPYFLLAAAPGAVKAFPKPGAWMETAKGVMGFLLAAAAVWLFYVLALQVDPARLALIQATLLGLALFLWLRHRWRGTAPQGSLRPALATAGTLAAAVLAVWLAVTAPAGASPTGGGETVGLIAWETFDRAEAESRAAAGERVFVDVTAAWCFTCKVNERTVLETEEIAAAFERFDIVPMKADWTRPDPEISRLLEDYERSGIPFYLLYRPGAEPHVFSELLTKREVLSVFEASAGAAPTERAAGATPPAAPGG